MPHATSTPRAFPHASSRSHSFTSTGSRPSVTATTMSGQIRFGADRVPFGQPVDGPYWDLTMLDRLQVPLTHYHE